MSFVTRLANGARVKVCPVATFSGIFYSRWQERKDILFIRAHANLARVFVDVGANAGILSAQLFDKFSTSYLFEPGASSYAALLENCGLNPHVECRTFNIAVADRNGEVLFLDEGKYSGTSRIVADTDLPDTNIRKIPVATLGRLLADVDDDMILKIDVEGAEELVFVGAEPLFKTQRFKLVMFERLGRTNLDKIRKFLDECEYLVFYVMEDGTPSQDESWIQKPLVNLFACPKALRKTVSRVLG